MDDNELMVYHMQNLSLEIRSRFTSDMGFVADYLNEGSFVRRKGQAIVHMEALCDMMEAVTGDTRFTEQANKLLEKKKGKKIISLSKKKKNSVTVKGKKAGSAKLTAKIKVGKKTYKKTCTVKVKKASDKTTPTPSTGGTGATPTPSTGGTNVTPPASDGPTATPTAGGGLRKLDDSYKTVTAPKQVDPNTLPTTPPSPAVDPETAVVYDEDFEGLEVGTKKSACDTTEECPDGISRFILRSSAADNNTDKDYLEVIDAKDVPESTNSAYKPRTGKVLKCYRDANSKEWQGPMLNLKGKLEAGATYEVSVWAYSPTSALNFNEQVKATEFTDETYAYMPDRLTETRWTCKGVWKQFKANITVPDDMYFYGFYFQSDDTSKGEIYVDDMKITKKEATSSDKSIASLKDVYKDVFPIVAAGTGSDAILGDKGIEFITNQYNAITPGNEMKPESIMGKKEMTEITVEEAKAKGFYIPEGYEQDEDNKNSKGEIVFPDLDLEMIDKILEVCHEKGLKLRGHTLCWHAQMPTYFFQKAWRPTASKKYNTSKENMDRRLEYFVKSTLEHIVKKDLELAGNDKSKCVLYAYDAVNEYLHSKGAQGTYFHTIYNTLDPEAGTGVTLRPSFVKDTFKWAHEILEKYDRKDVKMFYNDFNCYQCPEEIVHLIDFINEDGQICDGIGMQSHLTTGDPAHSADVYAQALECFRVNMPEMEIQVTELDATLNGKTDQDQAAYYDQIFGSLLQSKKKGAKITGITIWSLHDGVSWRASGKPCLFSGLFAPKSAFYTVIDAKKRYWD